jgi:hypothetical protein
MPAPMPAPAPAPAPAPVVHIEPAPAPPAPVVPAPVEPVAVAAPRARRAVVPAPVAPAPTPPTATTPVEPAPASAPDAELAAYKSARAAMRADLSAGLTELTAFITTYPHSRFDAEARLSIIECKVRLDRLAAAEPDVADFLTRFPTSERIAEVRFIRAEIQRQIHDRCDLALADYRAAAASPRVGDDARFFRGWCADTLGHTTERDDALRAYLDRAPHGRHATAATALLDRDRNE